MLKKFLALFVIFLFSLGLSGCTVPGTEIKLNIPFFGGNSTNETGNKEPVTLTYWGLFEPYEIYAPLIQKYQEQNPHVTIVYEEKKYDSLDLYKDTVLSKIKLKETTPDIVRVHSTWIADFSSDLAPATNNVITVADLQNDFYTTVSKDVVIGNSIYGIPLMYDSLALFYNKDMFQAGNYSPPTTWSEFSDISTALTVRDGNTILVSGASFGSADNVAHFSDVISLLMNQSNIQLPQDMQSTAMKEIITFYTNFVQVLKVWDRSQAYSPVSFFSEKSAMMFGPSWQLLEILEASPQLNVGVAPVPQVVSNDSLTQDNFANYWVESVNVNSKNKDEAWKFLVWLSQPEQLQEFYDQAKTQRRYGEPFPRVSMQNRLVSDQFIAPFYSYADNSESRKFAYGAGNSPYVEVLKNVVEGVLNGGDIDELLITAQQEYERLEQL